MLRFLYQLILTNKPMQKFHQNNPFHKTAPYLYSLKTSENLWFFDVFRGYRKRIVAQIGLIRKYVWDILLNLMLKGWLKNTKFSCKFLLLILKKNAVSKYIYLNNSLLRNTCLNDQKMLNFHESSFFLF